MIERVLVSFKWFLIALLALVLLWAGLAATKWLPATSAAERKSLGLLAAPPTAATGHRNAFEAIWLWQYDIPPAELTAVANADLAAFTRSMADPNVAFAPNPDGRYAKQEMGPEFSATLCASTEPDCLARIGSHVEATRTMLAQHAVLLAHARALAGYDHYHDRFPPHASNPLPEVGGMGMLLLGDAALRFIDGDKTTGLANACASARIWRTLALHADSRLVQAVASRYAIGSVALVAGMRAKMTADGALPEDCTAAFAPIGDRDAGICDVMKVEFAKNATALREIGVSLEGRLGVEHASSFSQRIGGLLVNSDAAISYSAPFYASYCTADTDVQKEAARDATDSLWSACGVQGALFDPIGCRNALLADPRHTLSLGPFVDLQRMIVLARAVFAPAPGAALPDGVIADAAQHTLRIARAHARNGEPVDYVLPLPGSRVP